MMSCMHILINDINEEENLECLCTLLRTIGGQLEHEIKVKSATNPEKYPTLEPYFDRLQKVVRERTTSSRIRCLIQDILDMRKRGWKERDIQKDNKPKTIDEVHKEHMEAEQRNLEESRQYQLENAASGGRTGGGASRGDNSNRRAMGPQNQGNRNEVNSVIGILKSQYHQQQNPTVSIILHHITSCHTKE